MTRAILSDAITLVRGDRFYTTDYTRTLPTISISLSLRLKHRPLLLAANLTVWGFQDCARDPNNGAFGAALPKLLMRHLPRHYPGNSVYSLFPFFTPSVTKQNLTNLGLLSQYADYNGTRPKPQPVPKVVDTIAGIKYIFKDPVRYKNTYVKDMALVTDNYGFMLSMDDPAQ
jgi:linoleate 10R-lipoxygenase